LTKINICDYTETKIKLILFLRLTFCGRFTNCCAVYDLCDSVSVLFYVL